MKKSVVIVGGGVSGLTSALLLSDHYDEVHLVEQQSELGGLLRSYKEEGHIFDYGTHLVGCTGVSEIDNLLIDNFKDDWHEFISIKSGNYHNSTLNETSSSIDLRTLDSDKYSQIIAEYINSAPTENYETLEDQLINTYGASLYDNVFKPIIKKFFGVETNVLSTDAHKFFVSERFIAFDTEVSRMIKQSDFLDRKFAYNDNSSVPSAVKSYYPKKNGVGDWIAKLEKVALSKNIHLHKVQSVRLINGNHKQATSVSLSNGLELKSDLLVWTIPTFLYIQACNKTFDSKPPMLRKVQIFNFVVDRPFLTDLFYFTCFDDSKKTFRVTLYNNMTQEESTSYRCSVEVLCNDFDDISNEIFEELISMKIIDPLCNRVHQNQKQVFAGFPIPTIDFTRQSKLQFEYAKGLYDNVLFFGKDNGTFFMTDVLKKVYSDINNVCSKSKDE